MARPIRLGAAACVRGMPGQEARSVPRVLPVYTLVRASNSRVMRQKWPSGARIQPADAAAAKATNVTSHRHESGMLLASPYGRYNVAPPPFAELRMLSNTPSHTLDLRDQQVLVVLDPSQPTTSAPVLVSHARLFRATDPVTCTVAVVGEVASSVRQDLLEFLEVLLAGHPIPARLTIIPASEVQDVEWAAVFVPESDALENARSQANAIAALHAIRATLDAADSPVAPATTVVAPQLCGTYIGRNRMLVRTCWGLPLLLPADDLSITPSLVLHGTFELSLQRFILRTLRAGDRAMDLGANVGTHTILMAQAVGPTGHVIAYEAMPDLAEFVRDNVSMNCLASQVTVVQKAAWSGDATLQFTGTAKFRGNGSIRAKSDEYLERYGDDEFQQIEVLAESPAVHDARGPFALVKVDVEGAEPDVLLGLESMIRAGRIQVLVIEYLHWVLGAEAESRLLALLVTYRDEHAATFARLDDTGQEHALDLEAIVAHRHFPDLVIRFPTAVASLVDAAA